MRSAVRGVLDVGKRRVECKHMCTTHAYCIVTTLFHKYEDSCGTTVYITSTKRTCTICNNWYNQTRGIFKIPFRTEWSVLSVRQYGPRDPLLLEGMPLALLWSLTQGTRRCWKSQTLGSVAACLAEGLLNEGIYQSGIR